ncbi:MAG: LysR family transcriptional regulator [Rhodobacteraceae bacterium]|nr:LysR family transcriptional regulator [Paracoccaceae bacterium]
MVDWDKLRTFREVARLGRLSLAADVLGISQSALSRQISALEYSLQTQLFHRHARGIILTEQGIILQKAVEEMGLQLNSATVLIGDDKKYARGSLRLTTTVGIGNLWLIPKLPTFYRENPDLTINLLLEVRTFALAIGDAGFPFPCKTREADVAIRMKTPSQADLIRRKLMDTKLQLFCSRNFLSTHGEITSVKNLEDTRLISLPDHHSASGSNLIAHIRKCCSFRQVIINNNYGVLQCVRNGVGVGVLPNYIHTHSDDIVQVLPEFESDPIQIYLAYPSELRNSRKVQAFREFILAEIRREEDLAGTASALAGEHVDL